MLTQMKRRKKREQINGSLLFIVYFLEKYNVGILDIDKKRGKREKNI